MIGIRKRIPVWIKIKLNKKKEEVEEGELVWILTRKKNSFFDGRIERGNIILERISDIVYPSSYRERI